MSRRLAVIDGLRLVAALAVLAFHYTVAWRIDGVRLPEHFLPSTVHVTIYGFLGVELFFLISGFVICMSSWGRTLGQFFASRVSRLFPAYWAAVVLTGLVAMLFPLRGGVTDGHRPSVLDVVVNLTMLQQPLGHHSVDGVYWTLFIELKFYLIMALVLARGGLTYRRAVLLCAVWMTAAVLVPSLGSPALNALVISDFAPYFIGGIALYLINRFGPAPLLFGITGLAWLVCLARVDDRMHDLGSDVPPWPGFVIITLSYGVLLLVALGYTERIQWRWLTVAGALTYPLYLLHSRIGHTVIRAAYERLTVPVWVLITVTTLLMLGLAGLVHRWVERPLGRRLRDLVLTTPSPVRTPAVPMQPLRPRAQHIETPPVRHDSLILTIPHRTAAGPGPHPSAPPGR
ncbi:acyltransferase [Paractinoplanes abujensis]|uniref:Peptidoglycan/LPS O-acetylase OafA/YrhL n=1 Tax=Paractinoplanes abujensis TaxID=882441 RepID=A0A7W7G4C8_9ACTN|nr:acyltransferase [Actinoplanes abujensis]MBB4693686.1 peptidoglycan/LPS O-acetylase OafA/YrhL [Actinoplanes abujensis]GID21657.1 acyltransferase [Actinoplanes abujensis]